MNDRPSIRYFWLWWLLATIVGTTTGAVIAFVGLSPLLSRSTQILYGIVIGAVFGAMVGTGQWLVLSRYLQGVGWWIPLTLIGWIVFWELELSGLLSRVLGQNSGIAFVSDTVHLTVFGLMLGVLQWLVLRQKVARAGWWVLASFVGAVLGALVADAVNYALASDSPVDFLTGPLIWAIVTGLCMTWLLQRSASRPRAAEHA